MRNRHGDGTIFQNKQGKWVAQVTTGYKPNGKRIRATRISSTHGEAKKKLQKLRELSSARLLMTSDNVTFGDFARRCLKEIKPQTCRGSTISSYTYLLEHYVRGYLYTTRLRDIDVEQITKLLYQLEKSGLGVGTRKSVRTVISNILQEAVRLQIIPINKARLVPVPKQDWKTQKTRVQEPLSKHEIKEVLNSFNGHQLRPVIQLAIHTGMRRGEVLGLNWSDIDFEHNTLKVGRSLKEFRRQQPDGKWKTSVDIDQLKTRNSYRTLPIGDLMRRVLLEQKREQAILKLAAGEAWAEKGFVFSNDIGGPLNPNGVSKNFRNHLRKNGLRHIRFHDLRHTTAVNMLIAGALLEEASQALGHSSISITKDIYAKYVPVLANRAIEKLSDYLGDQIASGGELVRVS